MEPTDLNSADNQRLEEILRGATPLELPDAGFSSRVLAALPQPVAPGHFRQRFLVFLAGDVAGLAFALGTLLLVSNGRQSPEEGPAALVNAIVSLANPLVVGGFTVAVGSLVFAFRHELRTQLFS